MSLVELDFGNGPKINSMGLEVPDSLVDVRVAAMSNIEVSNMEVTRGWRIFGVWALFSFFFLPALLG